MPMDEHEMRAKTFYDELNSIISITSQTDKHAVIWYKPPILGKSKWTRESWQVVAVFLAFNTTHI